MTGTLAIDVLGIGLLGPGLTDWTQGAAALREPPTWQHTPTQIPPPARLPPTERRRAGSVVKAAIVVADQACAAAGIDPATLATVFASSTGDPANCHALCEALAQPERVVSPTRFTNSVHNAPSGYWHIATHSMRASTSLGALDATFGAGLLEAATQCLTSGEPVLLVCCDSPYPQPLAAKRPVVDTVGVALVLAPAGQATQRLAALHVRLTAAAPTTPCNHAGLEALRLGNPQARALPLLQLLADGDAGTVQLEGLAGLGLAVSVTGRDAGAAT